MLKYGSIISNYFGPIAVLVICLLNHVGILFSIINAVVYFVISFVFWTVLTALIVLIPIQIMGHHPKPHSPFRWALTLDVAGFCTYWLNIRVKGFDIDKIPNDRPIIFYSNHQNFMDIFSLYLVLKHFPHAELFKQEHLQKPFVRGMGLMLGGVPIDRSDDRKGAQSILKVIKSIREDNVTFLIFPEGTRTKNSYLNEYKAGSFKVVQKTDCDLVIMAVDNTYKITKKHLFHRVKVDVRVVKVIKHEDLPETSHEIANLAHDLTKANLEYYRRRKAYLRLPNYLFK